MMDRRIFFLASGAGLSAFAAMKWFGQPREAAAASGRFEIEKTPEEWKRQLTPEQYHILREHGTEPPFSSPLNDEHREGIFACVGCDQPLYASQTKFDSGTGWPSFYDHLPNAIGTSVDRAMGFARTEVHCARCGGHLGHVFNDGPKPTGLRYCMDGIALNFKPAASRPS